MSALSYRIDDAAEHFAKSVRAEPVLASVVLVVSYAVYLALQ
jgi:hypothetical protein